jgi:tetratricopeptide (TPR) repeat protein
VRTRNRGRAPFDKLRARAHGERVEPRGLARPWLPFLAILLITSAAYASSFDGVLVFDDEPAIAANTHIRRLWPLSVAMSAPPDTTVSGRPVVSLSLAINYALAPAADRDVFSVPFDAPATASKALARNLWGYHLMNLAVHILAALTLFGLVRRTLLTPRMRGRYGDAATPLACGMALLWAVHPLQTGAVTYVVQRAESLMGLWCLLTLYCAIRAAEGPAKAGHHVPEVRGVRLQADHPWWTAAAVGSCALGMATKESMAAAPLIVVAWDHVFAEVRRSRMALYAALAATWVILAVLVAGGHRTHAVGFGFAALPWHTYLLTQAGVIVHYVRLAIVPWPLVLDYDWPAARAIAAAPAVAVVAAAVALTGWGLIRRAPAAFAGMWFFAILAPTSSVIPVATEIAAEHRMYLPLAAIVALVVMSAIVAVPRRLRPAFTAAIAVVIVVFGILTDARNRVYASYEGIWLDTIDKRPANSRARTNYATAMLLRGEVAEAERHLRAAVDSRPDSAEAQAGLGATLCAQDKFAEGIAHLQRAIAIEPDYADAHRDLGEAFAASGQLAAAGQSFERALALRPDDVFLLNRAAWIRATARDDDLRNGAQAIDLAKRAVHLTGRREVSSLDTLAAAYAEAGRFDEALAAGTEALMLARQQPDGAVVPELEQRLALYRAGQKVRQ